MNIIESIEKRQSTRSYSDKQLSKKTIEIIEEYISDENNLIGPFGNKIKLDLIQTDEKISNSIKNSKYYIVASYIPDKNSLLDVGYVFEQMILFLTALRLGTCWLGAFSNRDIIKEQISLNNNRIIVVSPIGYSTDKLGFKEKFIKFATKANKRKKFDQLFFNKKIGVPLEETNKKIELALKMIRLAPSHINQQPWIIVKDNDLFHFYLKSYTKNTDMSKIDIGIAMLHFEKTLNENHIDGLWFVEYPLEKIRDRKINYMSTFKIM